MSDNMAIIRIIKIVYKMLLLMTAFITAMILWCISYSPWWINDITGNSKLIIVALSYTIIYHILARMYQAYGIGEYRLTELAYFHILCFGLADFILFAEATIFYHRLVSILPILKVLFIQFIITSVFTLLCNLLAVKYRVATNVVIVYGKANYIDFINKLGKAKKEYKIKACLSENTSYEEIEKLLIDCDELFLYETRSKCKRHFILYGEKRNFPVYITRGIEEILAMGYEVSHTFDTPFMGKKREEVSWYYPLIKRVADISFSVVGLLLLLPLLSIVALCIKLYDGGPVFYKQERLTKDHKTFVIYKFRSMIVDAEKNGVKLASKNDKRITPIGKIIRSTRIDEFPQLINIIKGDMSIVGPRPERLEIETQYLKALPEFALRVKVKAGLTGYAQVFGKYNTTPYDKLRLDLLYINERSLLLDLKLIIWTLKTLFLPESAEGIENGNATTLREQNENYKIV